MKTSSLYQPIISWIKDLKLSRGCALCGYRDWGGSLHFHHLDKRNRKFSPSDHHNRPEEEMLSELQKCSILCSNCHMQLHGGGVMPPYIGVVLTETESAQLHRLYADIPAHKINRAEKSRSERAERKANRAAEKKAITQEWIRIEEQAEARRQEILTQRVVQDTPVSPKVARRLFKKELERLRTEDPTAYREWRDEELRGARLPPEPLPHIFISDNPDTVPLCVQHLFAKQGIKDTDYQGVWDAL
jgi:hypothetical protein